MHSPKFSELTRSTVTRARLRQVIPSRIQHAASIGTGRIQMKRSAPNSIKTESPKKAKRSQVEVPDYHLTPSVRDANGDIIWPAPEDEINEARTFILDCVASRQPTLIVPDKDADGLSSGAILLKTLTLLGLPPHLISTHLLQKGASVHAASERSLITAKQPAYIFVLDQGSRHSAALSDHHPHQTLIIDHHWAAGDDDFPTGARHVSACKSPPVATSAMLTYHICAPLHEDVPRSCDWLCAVGTHGDLGTTFKWEAPFPEEMKLTLKTYTKKAVNDAVSLVNAPRRTAAYNVEAAWQALTSAKSPAEVLNNRSLLEARAQVNAEVERCTHTAPKFSSDGRIAVFRINSQAQVHPVIATRWAGHLKSSKLLVILVANEGYLPDMVNFSCRIARSAKANDPPVNIIEMLEEVAGRADDKTFRNRLGESFARGHKEASGGIIPKDEFEEFIKLLDLQTGGGGKKKEADGTGKPSKGSPQKNTLFNYMQKAK